MRTEMHAPRRFRAALMAGICAISLGAAARAMAAEASAAPMAAAVVGEVIVTAQKRSEDVQRVPMAVSVLGAEAIKQRNIQTIGDVQNEIPGFKYGEFSGTANVSIRGVGTEFVSGAGQSSVAIYIDGVYLARLYSFSMGQYDLADIEVLRGPQGTLYGRNSTAGVVNFSTTAPTHVFAAGATVGVGNYADWKAAGYVSGPLTDKIRARLYIDSEEHDGYVKNDFTGQRLGDLQALGGRLSVDADVTDWWTAAVRASYRREDCTCFYEDGYDPHNILIPPPFTDLDPYRINSPVHDVGRRIDSLYSINNTFRLSPDISLVSITGYHQFTSYALFDALGNTLIPFPLAEHAYDSTITEEIDLKGNMRHLKWIAGFYYFHDEVDRAGADRLNTRLATIGDRCLG